MPCIINKCTFKRYLKRISCLSISQVPIDTCQCCPVSHSKVRLNFENGRYYGVEAKYYVRTQWINIAEPDDFPARRE